MGVSTIEKRQEKKKKNDDDERERAGSVCGIQGRRLLIVVLSTRGNRRRRLSLGEPLQPGEKEEEKERRGGPPFVPIVTRDASASLYSRVWSLVRLLIEGEKSNESNVIWLASTGWLVGDGHNRCLSCVVCVCRSWQPISLWPIYLSVHRPWWRRRSRSYCVPKSRRKSRISITTCAAWKTARRPIVLSTRPQQPDYNWR